MNKTIIILGDGMADYPVPELDGKTPLMVAHTPHMDAIAARGRTGLFRTIEDDMPTGSAVANLSVLGYDPRVCFQGRGVLEAASLGVFLLESDLAMRVNLVAIEKDRLVSHSAGHISNEDAAILIRDLSAFFKNSPFQITQGLSYRHLLVLPGGHPDLTCFPPHDFIGENLETLHIRANSEGAAETAELLNQLIRESKSFLDEHPLNRQRIADGKQPANALWPWSPGRKPKMTTMQERFGVKGAAISAVDLVKGLAVYAGMEVIEVEGATGLYDTNYEGKAQACLKALDSFDFVYVHVEAPDEAGHEQNAELKIRCIEDLDNRLIKILLESIEKSENPVTVGLLPDHPTPVISGKHVRDAVPVAVMAPDIQPDATESYDELSVCGGTLGMLHGDDFIDYVLTRKEPST